MQVSRPLSLPPSSRDNLYHGLPKTVKSALRSRLQSYDSEEEVCLFIKCSVVFFFSSNDMQRFDLTAFVFLQPFLCTNKFVPLVQRTVAQIKAEMQKTLRWLLPIAENTLRCVEFVLSYSDSLTWICSALS